MRTRFGIGIVILLCVASAAFSQQVQVNRQNRTVDVTVTAKVSTIADLAEVTIGCETRGSSHDQAYQQNLEKADKVLKALLDAGVPKTDIVSSDIKLEEDDSVDSDAKAKGLRTPRYQSHQSWKVRVNAADAQHVIDVAVAAGANGIENVDWTLSKPDAIEARARAAALEKARTTASEMAGTLGGKLGEVINVSNESVTMTFNAREAMTSNSVVVLGKLPLVSSRSLQLFPEKVEKEATVRVVFALE